jgi:hypothetical protein
VQVLNEFANVARRKMRMSWPETHTSLDLLRSLLTVHSITIETHETALALAERHNLSIYDAMIVASALNADCDTLWSEDLHHGLVIDGRLRITNPFGQTPCNGPNASAQPILDTPAVDPAERASRNHEHEQRARAWERHPADPPRLDL